MSENDRSKCKALLGCLSDYVDGTLSKELCEEIEHHLTECQDCRIVVDTLHMTVSLYHESAMEPAIVPGGVRERLFRVLNLEDYIQL
jgi:predicted anti-sigma-YlaC factor YlaD